MTTRNGTVLEVNEEWLPPQQPLTEKDPQLEHLRYAGWLHHHRVFTSPASASHVYRPDLWGELMYLIIGPRVAYYEQKTDKDYAFLEEDERHPGGVCRVGERHLYKGVVSRSRGVGFPTERVRDAIKAGWLVFDGQPGRSDPARVAALQAQGEAAIVAAAQAAAVEAYRTVYNGILQQHHAAGRLRGYPLL